MCGVCFARVTEVGAEQMTKPESIYSNWCARHNEIVPGPQNLQTKAGADVASHGSKSGFISTSHSSEGYVLGPAILLPLTALSPSSQYIPHSV